MQGLPVEASNRRLTTSLYHSPVGESDQSASAGIVLKPDIDTSEDRECKEEIGCGGNWMKRFSKFKPLNVHLIMSMDGATGKCNCDI